MYAPREGGGQHDREMYHRRMALQEDLDALYSCPLGEFLDRRKALAQAARKAGRKEDAVAIAGAAKPTPAAWAVNQLVRSNPLEWATLLEVGEQIRVLLRSTFAGHGDPNATQEVSAAQRTIVGQLTQRAGLLLEGAGGSLSSMTLERIAATLTTISTTGVWGGRPVAQLARELDPPSMEVLAGLVGDVEVRAASDGARFGGVSLASHPSVVPLVPSGATAGRVAGAVSKEEEVRSQEEKARRAAEEKARRAAKFQEQIEHAEAALRVASAMEDRSRAAVEQARAAVTLATSQSQEREAAAREARRFAAEQEQAAEEARRKAADAVLSAQKAEREAANAARVESAAKVDLQEAERALGRASAACISAEEALIRERRLATSV